MSSSEDFFNQSFSPVKKSGSSSKPPPPPHPAHSASSSMRSRASASASASSTLSTSTSSRTNTSGSITGSATASQSASQGYYRNNRASSTAARPTGNYYATTTSSSSTGSTTFPSYKGYSTNNYNDGHATNTIQAPSPYGSSSSANPSSTTTTASTTASTNGIASETTTNDDGDWFSGGSTATKTVTNNGMDNTTAMNTPYSSVTAPSPSPYMMPQPQQQQQQQQQINQLNQSQGQTVSASNSMEYLSGTMDNNAVNQGMSGPMMMSTNSSTNSLGNNSGSAGRPNSSSFSSSYRYTYNPDDFADEPPLLEELGINLSHIRTKSLSVILPGRYAKQAIDKNLMEDTDMAGPIAFGILLALELLLAGRIHFGYIYGFGLFGCLATTLIINLMSPTDSISVWTVVSILGYSLLPVNILAGINIFYRIRLMGDLGVVLSTIAIVWCTVSSTRLFERGCGLRDQRFLIGYPNALLYFAFVLLTIF